MAFTNKLQMVDREHALPGRAEPLSVPDVHFVIGNTLKPPFPTGFGRSGFAMGCFWGAERRFWEHAGVYTTAVGYAGGYSANPTYEEVCSGRTGHAEAVLVVWDPAETSYDALLKLFWEGHDPTQGMRQGHDLGTQYRSAIYAGDENELAQAVSSREAYQKALVDAGWPPVTTEIGLLHDAGFYYAEGYHQQYLAKNPGGYCGLGGTGVCLA
jgi:peptide-methionine (S)-S-oxide reductase